MTVQETSLTSNYYSSILKTAHLPTEQHAIRTSAAVLRTLGFNLSGGKRRQLAKALPEELAFHLKRGWHLLRFRNRNLSLQDFLEETARRTGNTDTQYARQSTQAVFRELKSLIDQDLRREVGRDLPPEVGRFWLGA